MRLLKVPSELQSPGHRYPRHNSGPGIEGYFARYADENGRQIETDFIFVPVHWTNNYVMDRAHRSAADLQALPEHQAILDALSPSERYFTVVQCDDGIYEDCPTNLVVFGAGGAGDVPIPLICEPHPLNRSTSRKLLASFVGAISSGGPSNVVRGRSSWDANAGGGPVRRRMTEAFRGVPDCAVIGSDMGTAFFRELLGNSRFALAPRGYGKTSFRLYEAMELGCVPVYLYDEPWLPYSAKLDWQRLAVLCHLDDIESLPERLASITENEIAEMLAYADSCYNEYFTLRGMSQQILTAIEEMT